MRYEILKADSLQALNEEVEFYMLKGWEPQGGVSIAALIGKLSVPLVYVLVCAQAMVKKE